MRATTASATRQHNGGRVSSPPSVAHNPGHGHSLRSATRSGGATGTGTPDAGTTVPTAVTGSPPAQAGGTGTGWWTAALDDTSLGVGSAAYSLCLYAQDRAGVADMVEDVEAATAALTSDDPALLRAFLTNGSQKVLAVVDAASTEPDVVLLHSPAIAARDSTTVTFVEGELAADNRANMASIEEEAYQAKDMVAQPAAAFEAAIAADGGRFAPKPRSSGSVETWKAAAMAYIPPILVVTEVQKKHTVASLYKRIKERMSELTLSPDQQAALDPMLRQLRGLGTNSKCGQNQHKSNAGLTMTTYSWGDDLRGDRAIRSTFVALGLEVRPTNAPVYQIDDGDNGGDDDDDELDAENEQDQSGDTTHGNGDASDRQARANSDSGNDGAHDDSRQNLAHRFEEQQTSMAGLLNGQEATGLPPQLTDLVAKMVQAATYGIAQGLGQTATARMMTSTEGLLDPAEKKVAGRIKVDDEDRAPLCGWNNQRFTEDGDFPLAKFYEKTTDSQRRRMLNSAVSDDKADPPLVFFAPTTLIKDLKSFKYAPSQDASNCNNWSRGITPATLAPRSKAEQQEIQNNEEARADATQVSLSEAKADFNRATKVPVDFEGMMLWLKHSLRFLQAFFPNGSLCKELDKVYKLLTRKRETLKDNCGRNQVAAILTVVTQAFMDYFATESTPDEISGEDPVFPTADLAALQLFLQVGGFPPTDSVDKSLLTFQPTRISNEGEGNNEERGGRRNGKRKTEEDTNQPSKRGTTPTKPGVPFRYNHRHATVAAVMDPLIAITGKKFSLVKLCRCLGIEGGMQLPHLQDRCARCELIGECYFGSTCRNADGHAVTKPMTEDHALMLAKYLEPGVDKYVKTAKASKQQQE